MTRPSIRIEGGVLLVQRMANGTVLTTHTGNVSYTVRLSRLATAQLADELVDFLTSEAPTPAPTIRQRLEGTSPTLQATEAQP